LRFVASGFLPENNSKMGMNLPRKFLGFLGRRVKDKEELFLFKKMNSDTS